jgi:hypothetical protein
MNKLKAIRTGLAALFASLVMLPGSASAGLIFSNNHVYAFGGDASAVEIFVEVFDNFAGDFGKYEWRYTVTNNSYDPNPGTSNGFSGFETALPAGVADLQDLYAPNANWIFDCCSGQPVEWDIRDSVGLGVMPIGNIGVFGFSSLPRLITQSEGWFHTWENDVQTHIVNYGAGNGVEVPDVLSPPTTVPAPATLALFGIGLAGLGWSRRKKA